MKNKIKSLFATPRQAVFSVACIVGAVAILGVGTAYATSAIAQSSAIGKANAQNFAFADAGVDPASAQVTKTEFDRENGQFVYDIEFIANDTEYEYWVKASDGSIVKKELDILRQDGATTTLTASITLDKAKEVAFKDAGVSASDVTVTKESLDEDDGVSMYDIEFKAGDTKYEYEINANTGDVYSKTKEVIPSQNSGTTNTNAGTSTEESSKTAASSSSSSQQKTQSSTTSSAQTSSKISLETAKSKALSDAGVSSSAVNFTKAKEDYDDGVAIYDIEFYTSTHEYEYEINAKTGAIHDKSVEAIKKASSQTNQSQQESSSGSTSSNYISLEEAKSIAVKKAGLSLSEVTFEKAKLDNDDGVAVYEIEFYKGRMEYDCEINAKTGAIIEFDSDYED